MQEAARKRITSNSINIALFMLLAVCLFVSITESVAEVFPKIGHVMTRGLVLGPNDKPIYAEIDENGKFVNDIGEAVGDYEKARVVSGDTYRGLYDHYKTHLQAHKDDHSYKGATVMTAEEYKSTDLGKVKVPKANWDGQGQSYTEVSIPKISLPDSIKSVLVRNANTIVDPSLLPPSDGSILFRSSIDLRKGVLKDLSEDIKSVLVGDKGEVLHTSTNNIGFKAAFYTDKEGNPHDSIRRNPREDTILGPVSSAKVEPSMGYSMGPTYTDEDGKFRTNFYVVPCPGFSYDHHFYFNAELLYRNYDPEAPRPIGTYFFKRDYYHYCSGYHLVAPGIGLGALMAQVNAIGIHATMAIPYNPVEIYVDVVQLGGIGQLLSQNGVIQIGDTTEYHYVAPPGTKVAPANLDLDNDRNYDTVTGTGNGNVGVYLGDKRPIDENGQPVEPDLIKVADTQPDWKHQGLLKGISEADFKETDIYIYRVSNGTLITKIEGLEHPYQIRDPKRVKISKDGKSFNYRVRIPGRWATKNVWRSITGSREEWQEALGAPPELSGREFDSLRPGEEVKIIAINRPTGYIGSQTVTIQPAGNGFLDFYIPPINMQAPNLKIKAERTYTVEAGLTKDEERDYTIGFEGAALTSDTMISIETEWFDHDGNPLPEDLEGYTGRLAKVTRSNSVEGGEVQQFTIQPGKHLEVLKFKGDILGTEHFYVHVSGYPEWRSAGEGAGAGPLQYRPKNYVPFMVPFLDETATREARNKARYAYQDGTTNSLDADAIYYWFYRPEMQFSVFDLLVKEIESIGYDKDGNEVKQKIYVDGNDQDVCGSESSKVLCLINSADQVKLFYELKEGRFPQLSPIGTERQLVFAIGAEEMIATSQNGLLIFENPEHLKLLGLEDYLSARLYQKGDEENVLWEFVFPKASIMVDVNRDGEIITERNDQAYAAYVEKKNTINESSTSLIASLKSFVSESLFGRNAVAEGEQGSMGFSLAEHDVVSKDNPFVFWLNTDFDAVLKEGIPDLDVIECPEISAEVKQTCEEDDLLSGNAKNSDDNHKDKIESLRDLEDFVSIEAKLRPYKNGETRVYMKAHGFTLNLFEGKWDKPNDYLTYTDKAKEQINDGKYLTTLQDGIEWEIPRSEVDNLFKQTTRKQTSRAKFILEGVSVNEGVNCETEFKKSEDDINTCYLEMRFEQKDDEGGWVDVGKTKKLYVIFREIKELYDHYTVDAKWNDKSSSYRKGILLSTPLSANVPSDKYDMGLWDEDNKNQYVLFVHGWRMQPPERMVFAETALKRMYWQGYKGKFGLFSWPTEWFYKPAWVGTIEEAIRAAADPRNYDRSEAIARRSGMRLASTLRILKNKYSAPVNIFAHSMGNIVVSEALLSSAGVAVNNYVAMQAASTADAYTSEAPLRVDANSRFPYDDWVGQLQNSFCCHTTYYKKGPNGTRVAYNPPIFGDFDRNPKDTLVSYGYRSNEVSDMYSFVTPERHSLIPNNEEGVDYKHYYNGIGSKIQSGGVINFYNSEDYALGGWQFNQILKPDFGEQTDTGYTRDIEYTDPLASREDVETEWTVIDYWRVNNVEIDWSNGRYSNPGHPEIMAYIVPARSFALGADSSLSGKGEIKVGDDLSGMNVTGQSYDHSAQFLSNIQKRKVIWRTLLNRFGFGEER